MSGAFCGPMGWSSQKPERKAREADDEAIERWRREDWPRMKKTPREAGVASFLSTKAASCCNPRCNAPGRLADKRPFTSRGIVATGFRSCRPLPWPRDASAWDSTSTSTPITSPRTKRSDSSAGCADVWADASLWCGIVGTFIDRRRAVCWGGGARPPVAPCTGTTVERIGVHWAWAGGRR